MALWRTRSRWVQAAALVAVPALVTAVHSWSAARPPVQPTDFVVDRAFHALATADLDRLVGWYCDNLAFRIDRSGTTKSGIRGAILSRPDTLLEVLQLPTVKSGTASDVPNEPRILKIGFEVRDLDGLYTAVRRRGLTVFGDITRPEGSPLRTFGLKDPDGNIVQFFGK